MGASACEMEPLSFASLAAISLVDAASVETDSRRFSKLRMARDF
jgi:hypothetical protein